jgi:hypothetical protein
VNQSTWKRVEFVPEKSTTMKNRKIGFKLDFSLLQQTCEFRRSTAEIFRRRQRQF